MLSWSPLFGAPALTGVLAVSTPDRQPAAGLGEHRVPRVGGTGAEPGHATPLYSYPGGSSRRGLAFAFAGGDAGSDDDVTRQAVARARVGDRAAAEYCYLRFAGHVRRYVQSIVHDSHDAEDVTHNVFIKTFGCLDRYDERIAPFSAWLLRIARNAALDHLRRSRALPLDELAARRSAATGQDPDASAALRDAFGTLPNQQRVVLFLRHVLGLSPDEIAHELGRTQASVNGLQHRGRGALKAALRRADMMPTTLPSEHR
jgi:RNA polymerase sigma-70 factor, ECF subfamily